MQANISLSAMDTLNALDEGSVFNVTHCYARELISAGLALDDAGRLRITELGRLTVRHASRSYATADEHHANLDRFATPIDSHPDVSKPGRRDYCPDSDRTADWPPIDRSPNTWWKNTLEPLGPDVDRPPVPEKLPPATGPLAWDRARVIRAAGIANGQRAPDLWVPVSWMEAFMDAYES